MRLLPCMLLVLVVRMAAERCADPGGMNCCAKPLSQEHSVARGAPSAAETPAGAEENSKPKEEVVVEFDGLAPIRLIYIDSASFIMGSRYARPQSLKGIICGAMHQPANLGPKHRVTITKGFYLAQTETRVDHYCAFLNDVENPEQYLHVNVFTRIALEGDLYVPKPGTEACAANTVPWIGAKAFCNWLSQRTGRHVRLPTEAEWELAAYGPEKREYAWGSEYPEATREAVAQYFPRNPGPEPWNCAPVASAPKNVTPDGLYDMTDVTAEWVSDWYAYSYDVDDNIDPQGPACGEWKVLRGSNTTVKMRKGLSPPTAGHVGWVGFRVLIEEDEGGS